MRRAYKFLLRPASQRAQSLVEMLRGHCSLYHGVLRERRAAYGHVSETSIRYGDQSAPVDGDPGVRPATPGPLVVLQPAGHVAAPGQGVRRVLPAGHGRREARLSAVSWRELV